MTRRHLLLGGLGAASAGLLGVCSSPAPRSPSGHGGTPAIYPTPTLVPGPGRTTVEASLRPAHWHLEGNIIEKEYSVTSEGRTIIDITQKWLRIRDAYTMDVDSSVSPALASALIWAVDAFREQR